MFSYFDWPADCSPYNLRLIVFLLFPVASLTSSSLATKSWKQRLVWSVGLKVT